MRFDNIEQNNNIMSNRNINITEDELKKVLENTSVSYNHFMSKLVNLKKENYDKRKTNS